jgi:hypothetical protein
MKISREDLLAAAGAGLLQYRQIEPLLVFLLQHDLLQAREAMLGEQQPKKSMTTWLAYAVAMLAFVTACMFTTLVFSKGLQSLPSGPLMVAMACYLVAVVGVVAWVRRRGFDMRIRLMALFGLVSLPLAVLTLHQVTFA